MEDLQILIEDTKEAKAIAKEAADQAKSKEMQLVQKMREYGQRTATAPIGNQVIKATLVESQTTEIDEKGLAKALGARAFNKVTVRKLDKKKLETAIISSEIDSVLVSQYTTFVQRAPYVRISEMQANG